jgi:hypothetical protein
LLGISAFCDFCLAAISHQGERKRIGIGSNCVKIRTCRSIVEHSEATVGNRAATNLKPDLSCLILLSNQANWLATIKSGRPLIIVVDQANLIHPARPQSIPTR